MSTETMKTEVPMASLTSAPCKALGCSRVAFGDDYCALHRPAFAGETRAACRAEGCPYPLLANGLCRAHYARWARWKKKTQEGDERWMERDWARPVGEAVRGERQVKVYSRIHIDAYRRIEASCREGESVYDRIRALLEEAADRLPAAGGADEPRRQKRSRRAG
jgi:hypothetical protein